MPDVKTSSSSSAKPWTIPQSKLFQFHHCSSNTKPYIPLHYETQTSSLLCCYRRGHHRCISPFYRFHYRPRS
ncbi:hypothetical protein [Rubritalea tangerina]|uniref:hypothetical protein n=1 Tax=Rubritalea tangerina TaxID=430798 RepID=UPI0036117DE6